MNAPYPDNPFQSFWWGGYECTDQLNCFGHRVDFLPLTGHLQLLDEDYENLKQFEIGTVREGIRWAHIEKGDRQIVLVQLCLPLPRLCRFLPQPAARRRAHRNAHQRG